MFLQLSRFFLFASVFCVIIVLSTTFFPFIGGKYYFFRISIEASLAFLLLWWGFQAPAGELERRIKMLAGHWLFRATSLFTFVFLLAAIFADDPHVAFWSNYERGDGAFQMLHYYGLFVLAGLLFQTWADWKKVFRLSIIAAVIMILYGFAAAAFFPGFVGPYRTSDGNPIAASLLGRVFSNARFQGSLGNPAYVAPYLMFAMFYVFYLWVGHDQKRDWKKHAGYAVLIAFFLTFFLLSQTRGGFLGLAAAIVLFFLYIAFSDKRFRKPAAIGLGVIGVLAAIAFAFRGQLVARDIPGSRLLTISVKDQTAQTRFWTWGTAWRGFKERPILGWGPENFSTVFDKYFDTRHFVPAMQTETWFDRAHSVIFDYLAETGILGFFGYLAMLGAFYYEFFKAPFRSALPVVIQALLFVMPIAYFIQGLILFDVLAISMNLFLVFAFSQFAFNNRHVA